jgi:hypothetical protein
MTLCRANEVFGKSKAVTRAPRSQDLGRGGYPAVGPPGWRGWGHRQDGRVRRGRK